MSKFAVLLALYAAVVATLLYLGVIQPGGHTPAVSGPAPARDAGSEDARTFLADARALWREELKGTLKDINWRFAEMDKLRASMETGLQEMQKASEDGAQANYGMLESIREDMKRFGTASDGASKLVARLESLEERLKAVEDRPPQIIRETILKETGGGTKAEPHSDRPTLPTEEKKDPAVVAKEIAAARAGLSSDDVDVLFPAIQKVVEHRVMDLVPRLVAILGEHKDEFARMAAAAALGEMKAADAVLPLADALVDKVELVAAQANTAIRQVTGFDTELASGAGIRRRRAARNKVKAWWRDNEAAVRKALGQPATGG